MKIRSKILYCTLGVWIGYATLVYNLPPIPDVNEPLRVELVELRSAVERDDKILNHILGTWDRNKPIFVRSRELPNGEFVWYYTQDAYEAITAMEE